MCGWWAVGMIVILAFACNTAADHHCHGSETENDGPLSFHACSVVAFRRTIRRDGCQHGVSREHACELCSASKPETKWQAGSTRRTK